MADKPATIVAAILVSVIGGFPIFTLPMVGPVLQAQLGLTIQEATAVGFVEVAGVGLASILAMFWIQRINWRTAAIIAVVAVLVGNVLTTFQTDATTITAIRFLTGFLGEGTAFALGLAIIARTKETDRNFAFIIAAQVAFGVITLLTLIRISEMSGSIGGIYIPLAAFAALALIAVKFIPDGGDAAAQDAQIAQPSSMAAPLVGLAVLLIWCTGLGAVWAFIVGIGVAGGLEPASASFALAISSTIAISGALAASAMGDKYGRLAPVSIALIIQMVMISLLTGEMSFMRFAATAAIFQVFWNLTGPYLMGMIASSDASGRAAVLIPAAQTGGFFLGPAIATLWVTEGNLYPANVVGIIGCLVAVVIFVPLVMRLNKASAARAAH